MPDLPIPEHGAVHTPPHPLFAETQRRLMRNELRICMDVSWWERLVERTGQVERWECRDAGGRWRRYWRRHGSLPRWAKP